MTILWLAALRREGSTWSALSFLKIGCFDGAIRLSSFYQRRFHDTATTELVNSFQHQHVTTMRWSAVAPDKPSRFGKKPFSRLNGIELPASTGLISPLLRRHC